LPKYGYSCELKICAPLYLLHFDFLLRKFMNYSG